MPDDILRFALDGRVAVLRLDDGKANAISPTILLAFQNAMDRAEKEAGAVALLGRPGRFSAGFDLSVIRESPDAARRLIGSGAELLLRLVESPLPVVAGCTGHALAMGALLLLASDLRIGAQGDFKLGLNEVAIGMTLPLFAVELANERLSRRHRLRSAGMAEIYDPAGAVDAGYLDYLVAADQLEDRVIEEARRLAEAPAQAYAGTKQRLRGETARRIRDGLDADMAKFSAG